MTLVEGAHRKRGRHRERRGERDAEREQDRRRRREKRREHLARPGAPPARAHRDVPRAHAQDDARRADGRKRDPHEARVAQRRHRERRGRQLVATDADKPSRPHHRAERAGRLLVDDPVCHRQDGGEHRVDRVGGHGKNRQRIGARSHHPRHVLPHDLAHRASPHAETARVSHQGGRPSCQTRGVCLPNGPADASDSGPDPVDCPRSAAPVPARISARLPKTSQVVFLIFR